MGALVGLARARARVEAQLLDAVAGVVAGCRQGRLAEQGLVDPGDPEQDPDGDAAEAWVALSGTDRRRIDDDARRRATTEVATALGLKPWEARLMVGLVMAADEVRALACAALERGETSWPQLRRFWELAGSKVRKLTPDQQELVAQALFGTDPRLAAAERFDPDGQLALGLPWPQERFEGAVEREVKACEGVDVVAERERRNRARAGRRCSVRVHDDGTATFSVRAPVYKVLAAHDRHDNVARTLRAAGHPDPIAALAADSAIATLAHGTLDVSAAQIDELSDADLEDLIAVVNGHPRITLQVIVPADVLGLGHPVCATCTTELDPTTAPSRRDAPSGERGSGASEGSGRAGNAGDEGRSGDGGWEPRLPFDHGPAGPPLWARPGPGEDDPTRDAPIGERHARNDADGRESSARRHHEDSARHHQESSARIGYDPSARPGRGQVGEIIGSHPAFISPGLAREFFYFPGTTMYRLMTDPVDGRCIERTIRAYRPDADMRRQVRAADVYSRHPLSRKSGRSLEIDHVIPYSTDPEGTTSEPNLANLDLRTHKIKTIGELVVTINERRDLGFTTLMRQVTRSRAHDYSQYLKAAHPEDLDDQADLADQALLAALAQHPEHWATDPDSWITLDHTDPTTGRTVPGPHPDTPHHHTLLGIPAAPADIPDDADVPDDAAEHAEGDQDGSPSD